MAKLLERQMVQSDFARQSFRVTPAAGTKFEDMLLPEYWAHVAGKVNPHDLIDVIPEDGSFYARLIVLNQHKLWLKVHKLEYVEFVAQQKAADVINDKYEAKFSGPAAKWRVVNKKDGAAISNESFQTRDDAEKWLADNAKDLAA